MKRRTLKGLEKAELLKGKPRFIPTIKHRGSRKAGIDYEKKVADRLRDMYGDERVLHNPWFKYIDKRGAGWCCPDVLLLPSQDGEPLVIVECKLTTTKKAFKKLKNFYIPTAQMIWPQHKIKSLMVAYNMSLGWDGPLVQTLEEVYNEEVLEGFTYNWRDL